MSCHADGGGILREAVFAEYRLRRIQRGRDSSQARNDGQETVEHSETRTGRHKVLPYGSWLAKGLPQIAQKAPTGVTLWHLGQTIRLLSPPSARRSVATA